MAQEEKSHHNTENSYNRHQLQQLQGAAKNTHGQKMQFLGKKQDASSQNLH